MLMRSFWFRILLYQSELDDHRHLMYEQNIIYIFIL